MTRHNLQGLLVAVVSFVSAASALSACGKPDAPAQDVRPVRTVTVEQGPGTDKQQVTGEIAARNESDLGFRTDGKIIERPIDVGSTVKKGELLARLDPQPRQQDLLAAKANYVSAQATLAKDQSTEVRQGKLLKDGYTTQANYDDALSALRTAQSQLDSASAKLRQAQDNLGYTELRADTNGVITAVNANVGQVINEGQAVVRLAQPNEREAVFNISDAMLRASPKDPPVTVALSGSPSISTVGSVRYVSPQADPKTRTYEVRVSLPNAPSEMRLGSTVTGTADFFTANDVVQLPGGALFQQDGKPAVWVVDPKTETVSLKQVVVERYSGDQILIAGGMSRGDVVVTAGVQKLIPGQKVRLLNTVPQ